MLIKILIVINMVAILLTLFKGLFFLTKAEDSKKTVNMLSWRIGLSISLFLLIVLGIYLGVIEPHGLPMVAEKK